MKPVFWKLSQGGEFFGFNELLDSIEERLVYVHQDTGKKGQSNMTQGESFLEAKIGDYFYLTHGNAGVYLFGQFTGPVNYLTKYGNGWLDRPFRIIRKSMNKQKYTGPDKWWSPNHRSTFIKVPDGDLDLLEEVILQPYFDILLSEFGLEA